ncbi:MAG TPA: glutamine amidotransferase [Eubacteriaceae bacterium]|jgi:CobQ-like glutamine amidotransferase family enzyme|nr:glutamine amidotransferase [Eubacteriaceae bacterium]
MKIEILFGEVCSLYGDHGNIMFLEKTFGKNNINKTSILETPKFITEKIDLIYMGAMNEKTQAQVIDKLLPFKDILLEKLDNGLKALFTGTAMDILGKTIVEENGTTLEGLNIFDFETRIKKRPRLNCAIYGLYKNIPIVGHKTQFTQTFGDNSENYFIKVQKGMGINKNTNLEGFIYKNLIATNITGPLLIMNPQFSENYLGVEIPYKNLLLAAQNKRIKDTNLVKDVFY